MNFIKNSIFILILISISSISAQESAKDFTIKYISNENIYIDGGSIDGLAVGDTIIVMRKNTRIAVMTINYTADHSAACTIVSQSMQVQPGDLARPLVLRQQEKFETVSSPLKTRKTILRQKTQTKQNDMKIRGSVSLQWYHFEDMSEGNFSFDQPGGRLNLRMKNVFTKNLNFRIKTKSRYNKRMTHLSGTTARNEWRNRIYTVSLSFDDDNAAINYKLGRIISNKFSGIGYIDGALIQHNTTENLRYGVFAGTQPQWQYADFQTSIQKYGAYINYLQGQYGGKRFESTLAAAGEYHGAEVSREFVYLQNSFSSQQFNLYSSAELDVNRDWRKDKSGENISLTNLYLNFSYAITRSITTGLSFDDRKNYYTYEIRSVADSLFDDAMRYGARWNLNLRLPGNYRVYANAGIRARETDTENTYSGALGVSKNNITDHNLYVNFYGSGFQNYFSTGFNASLRMGKYFRAGHNVNMSYGNYSYVLSTTNTTRSNHWLRLNGNLQIFRHIYLDENYEYIWGSDSPGHRIYIEMGYRF